MRPPRVLRESLLARNTLWLVLGQGGRTIVQAAYFIIIARALGADGYGAFVAAFAVSALLAPFATLGSGHVLIRESSRDPSRFGQYWSAAMTATLVVGLVASLIVAAIGRLVLPQTISWQLIACVAIADVACAGLLQLCGQAYQARQQMGRGAQLAIVTSLCRLAAAGAFLLVGGSARSATAWGGFYLAASVASAIISIVIATRAFGTPSLRWTLTRAEIRDGCYFAASTTSQTVYNDIDKTMLARIAPTLVATGIYGAAYRLIDVALVPIRSIGQAAYPRFFQQGAGGIRHSAAFARRLLPPIMAYATVATIGLIATAPLLPLLLGTQYAMAVEAVRWLAPLLIFKALQYGAADTLTGAGYQGSRTVVQVIVAVFNIGINIPLITMYSWRGAAWASLASDGLLAVLLWLVVWRRAHEELIAVRHEPAGLSSLTVSST